jgi:integrase/recombinase XerD
MDVVAVRQVGRLDTPEAAVAFTEQWLLNRRFSGGTRDAYRRDVDYWLAWCAANGRNPLTATFVDVNAWARELEESLTAATVKRRLSAVSSWYAFLVQLDVLSANPASGADRPHVDQDYSPTESFGAVDAAAILAAACQGDEHLGDAALPLAAWLVEMGTRVSETCLLDVDRLGQRDGYRTVTLTVKGGRPLLRTIPPGVIGVLDPYLERRAGLLGVTVEELAGPLFLDRRGRRVDRHQVARLVRRLAREAGIPNWQKISPHSFRHAWNDIARQAGAGLEARQDAMGHRDPRTTRRYDRRAGRLASDPAILVSRAVAEQGEEP